MICAVRQENIEHAGRDRLDLLERRHRLRPDDVDPGFAAADLGNVLLEHLGDHVGGLEARVPRGQQLVGFGGRGRSERDHRAGKRRQRKALHGPSPCGSAGRS
jgi:hypothetical protein